MSKGRIFALATVPAAFIVGGPAFAQEVVEVISEDPTWLPYVIGGIAALIPAALSVFTSSSGSWWMKIIDAVAFNWGKARNDPGAQ